MVSAHVPFPGSVHPSPQGQHYHYDLGNDRSPGTELHLDPLTVPKKKHYTSQDEHVSVFSWQQAK
jgi:hypothetical protein